MLWWCFLLLGFTWIYLAVLPILFWAKKNNKTWKMPKCAVDLENLTHNWENKHYVKTCRSPWFFVRPVFSSFSGGSFSHFDRVLNYKIWFSSSFTHVSPNVSRLFCRHEKELGLWWRPVGGWVESTSSGDGRFFRPRRCLPLWIDRFRIDDMIGAGGVTRWGGVRFGEVEVGGFGTKKQSQGVFFGT